MSGGFGGVDGSARRHRRARSRGARAHQDQHRRAARRQRSHGARPARAFPRHRRHRAVHRVHGRRHAQSLGSALGRAVARAAGAHSRALAAARRAPAHYRGEVAERYAFDDGAGEIGFISSVSAAVLRRLHRARACPPTASFYTCLFATPGTDLRGPLRAGASDEELLRGWSAASGPAARDRYSELRASLRRARPRAAQDRDELHRRVSTMLSSRRRRRPARPWSTSAARPVTRRTAVAEARVRFPREAARDHSRAGGFTRRRGRCSTRRSSPASWPRSARTS